MRIKEEELFYRAVELPPDERRKFLDEACGRDVALRAEVESLLDADARVPEQFIERSDSIGDERALAAQDVALPSRIGPYAIESVIGEGGMGIVYEGVQEKPVRRRVAIKVIKQGMDSRAVLARFEAERQALALMDHPGIARMLDAGATPEGRPYFAMEHVDGVPIDAYCDRNALDLEERVRLFMEVCQAVLHAHQKAVLHRDLKPTNVLVTDVDGKPVPKIIDFGLAKALGHTLTEKTLVTEQGLLVGTPEYMSPEQIDSSALPVDTRTDIYSLGVILYRLVTGALPFDLGSIREAGRLGAVRAIQSLICETDPPRPSTKVASARADGAAVARPARAATSILASRLRGDLDWIILKSLEKDRSRRYATAADFAEDLRRHLEHEPVRARPPSATYRLGKLVRRNSGAVASLVALFALLAAGVVVSTAFFLRSEAKRAEAEDAKQKAEAAKSAAQESKLAALEAKRDAEAQEQVALQAKAEAERRRDEVLRLSDTKRLEQLEARQEKLWPAHPPMIGPMTEWLAEAGALARNLDAHRAFLLELRERATPAPTGSEGGSGKRWIFEDTETEWQHDVLEDLVTALEKLVNPDPRQGTIASLKERLAFASTIEKSSIGDQQAKWDEAIRSIRDETECPKYRGLAIKPQIGLVPIGRNLQSGLHEFVHVQTGTIPERDGEGRLRLTEETGLVFVLIPGGSFLMGAQKDDPEKPNFDPQSAGSEGPVHELLLDPYFLSKYEMTQAQWERFTGKKPSYYQLSAPLVRKPRVHPVENVSWGTCSDVMARLGLVMPTEAQWENATRAGTTSRWWTGRERDSLIGAANLADQAAERAGAGFPESNEWPELDDGWPVHAPVGSYRANAFGLHDVCGNVSEWCRDRVAEFSEPAAPGDGERHPPTIRGYVIRGGSFSEGIESARSACRRFGTYYAVHAGWGIRPARVLEP